MVTAVWVGSVVVGRVVGASVVAFVVGWVVGGGAADVVGTGAGVPSFLSWARMISQIPQPSSATRIKATMPMRIGIHHLPPGSGDGTSAQSLSG
jgi:hypothetical protein